MVRRDPVNITAALICNGRHFVRRTVRWGVAGECGTRECAYVFVRDGTVCVCVCVVPLKNSHRSKGCASANCVLASSVSVHNERLSKCVAWHVELFHHESLTY